MNTGITEGRAARRGEGAGGWFGCTRELEREAKGGRGEQANKKTQQERKKITREKEKTHEYTVKKERIVSDGLLP